MFKASDDKHVLPRITKTLDNGRRIFDVGHWSSLTKIAWDGLKDKQKEKYNRKASEFMREHADAADLESDDTKVSRRQ